MTASSGLDLAPEVPSQDCSYQEPLLAPATSLASATPQLSAENPGAVAADGQFASAAAPTVIEVRNLTKSFGAVRALRGVSFEVRAGEVLGLIGDNGAGKSTLVKCVAGIIKPDGGEICIEGEEVEFSSPKDAHARGIETVHQDLALIDSLDVTGNLFLNREILYPPHFLGWMNKREMHRQAKTILESLHINIPSVRYPVEKLSGGQRQAVAVGRSVAWGRRIVLMDEPAAALGVEQSQHVLDLVETLRDRGIVVLLISHNMQEVLSVCSRAVVLRHGLVVADIPLAGVESHHLVQLITTGRSAVAASSAATQT